MEAGPSLRDADADRGRAISHRGLIRGFDSDCSQEPCLTTDDGSLGPARPPGRNRPASRPNGGRIGMQAAGQRFTRSARSREVHTTTPVTPDNLDAWIEAFRSSQTVPIRTSDLIARRSPMAPNLRRDQAMHSLKSQAAESLWKGPTDHRQKRRESSGSGDRRFESFLASHPLS